MRYKIVSEDAILFAVELIDELGTKAIENNDDVMINACNSASSILLQSRDIIDGDNVDYYDSNQYNDKDYQSDFDKFMSHYDKEFLDELEARYKEQQHNSTDDEEDVELDIKFTGEFIEQLDNDEYKIFTEQVYALLDKWKQYVESGKEKSYTLKEILKKVGVSLPSKK